MKKTTLLLPLLMMSACASAPIPQPSPFANRSPASSRLNLLEKTYQCYLDSNYREKSGEVVRKSNETVWINGKESDPSEENLYLTQELNRDALILGRRDSVSGEIRTTRYCRLSE